MVRLSLLRPSAAGAGAAAGATAGFIGEDFVGGAFGAGSGAFAVATGAAAGRRIDGPGIALSLPGRDAPAVEGAAGRAAGATGGSGNSARAGSGTAGGGAAVASLSMSIGDGGSLPGNASPRPATLET